MIGYKYNNGRFSLILRFAVFLACSGTQLQNAHAFVLPMQRLRTEAYTDAQGFAGTRIHWHGGTGGRRSVHLVDNRVMDPTGHWGGYARTITYPLKRGVRTCRASVDDYPGFGMVVNHIPGSSVNSVRRRGSKSALSFAGANHAIYTYAWNYAIDGAQVTITVQWLFVTGQPAPIYAITYDLTAAAEDQLLADTRAPYGDIDWDGGVNANVDGVEWGDDKIFASLGGVVTLQGGWEYRGSNIVPYTKSYAVAADAEMGLVQTQTQAQHSAGSYSDTFAWADTRPNGPMPIQSDWPFQLHQWSLPQDTASKRSAWGSNCGAVGQRAYPTRPGAALGQGYPYQSYAVYVVMDAHSAGPVDAQVAAVEALQQAHLESQVGAVVRGAGPGGVGRTDHVDFAVAGLNPVYNTWELDAAPDAGQVSFCLTAGAETTLQRPTFVIHGIDTAPQQGIYINGRLAKAQADYFLSEDPKKQQLWLTLAANVTDKVYVELRVAP